jgi:hypothetical protein
VPSSIASSAPTVVVETIGRPTAIASSVVCAIASRRELCTTTSIAARQSRHIVALPEERDRAVRAPARRGGTASASRPPPTTKNRALRQARPDEPHRREEIVDPFLPREPSDHPDRRRRRGRARARRGRAPRARRRRRRRRESTPFQRTCSFSAARTFLHVPVRGAVRDDDPRVHPSPREAVDPPASARARASSRRRSTTRPPAPVVARDHAAHARGLLPLDDDDLAAPRASPAHMPGTRAAHVPWMSARTRSPVAARGV